MFTFIFKFGGRVYLQPRGRLNRFRSQNILLHFFNHCSGVNFNYWSIQSCLELLHCSSQFSIVHYWVPRVVFNDHSTFVTFDFFSLFVLVNILR